MDSQQIAETDIRNKAKYIIDGINYRWECYNLGIINCEQTEGTFNQKLHQMAQDINMLNINLMDLKISQRDINTLSNQEMQPFFNRQLRKSKNLHFGKDKKGKWNHELIHNSPHNFVYNNKAITILDNIQTTTPVKIALSLGNKFIHSNRIKADQIEKISEMTENITNNIKNHQLPYNYEALTELRILPTIIKYDNPSRLLSQKEHTNSTKAFLRRCQYCLATFLENNKEIIKISADKGNITVLLYRNTYNTKLYEHIYFEQQKGTYTIFQTEVTVKLIYNMLRDSYNRAKFTYNSWINKYGQEYSKQQHQRYMALPDIPVGQPIPPIYGSIKTHKENLPIRPIVADCFNPLANLEFFLKNILEKYINKQEFPFILNNSEELILNLNQIKQDRPILFEHHQIYTLDYTSMYTNINLNTFYHIIAAEHKSRNIIIPIHYLTQLLHTCLTDYTYFSAPNKNQPKNEAIIIKQEKGIPMGGKLSYIISEIVTARALEAILKEMPKNTFSFFYKYVDDMIIGANPNFFPTIVEAITKKSDMEITITKEDSNNSINYLDITLKRIDRKLQWTWFHKPYASLRSLDFFSAHDTHMKIQTYKNMLRKGLTISNYARKKVENTLRHIMITNHFPKHNIHKLINNFYTEQNLENADTHNYKKRKNTDQGLMQETH